MAITQLLLGQREKLIESEGQTPVDRNFHRQVAPFLAIWGRNIDAQGWATCATRTSSRWSEEETQIPISYSLVYALDAGLLISQGADMLAHHTTTKPEKVFPPIARRLAEEYIYDCENAPMNVKFKYMYRDASNYKQHGVAVFSNPDHLLLDEIERQIRACLQDGERFIARQMHIEECFFDVLHDDDHPWHEFNGLGTTVKALFDPDHWNQKGHRRDINEFLADLEEAHRAGWDEMNVRKDLARQLTKQKRTLKRSLESEEEII